MKEEGGRAVVYGNCCSKINQNIQNNAVFWLSDFPTFICSCFLLDLGRGWLLETILIRVPFIAFVLFRNKVSEFVPILRSMPPRHQSERVQDTYVFSSLFLISNQLPRQHPTPKICQLVSMQYSSSSFDFFPFTSRVGSGSFAWSEYSLSLGNLTQRMSSSDPRCCRRAYQISLCGILSNTFSSCRNVM